MLFPASHQVKAPRVVITGAGLITALGQGWKMNAQGFRSGRLALRLVTLFDVSRQRVKVAGEVELPAVLPKTKLSAPELRRMDRAGKLLLLAAHEAWGLGDVGRGGRFPSQSPRTCRNPSLLRPASSVNWVQGQSQTGGNRENRE